MPLFAWISRSWMGAKDSLQVRGLGKWCQQWQNICSSACKLCVCFPRGSDSPNSPLASPSACQTFSRAIRWRVPLVCWALCPGSSDQYLNTPACVSCQQRRARVPPLMLDRENAWKMLAVLQHACNCFRMDWSSSWPLWIRVPQVDETIFRPFFCFHFFWLAYGRPQQIKNRPSKWVWAA